MKETCEHQQLDIARLREHNRSLKFQLEERSRIGRPSHGTDASPSYSEQHRLLGQSAWDHPLVNYGSFAPGSHAREHLVSVRAKYVSMKASWTYLISKGELKAVREAMKLTQDLQESVSFARQYCPWPWGQRLTVDTCQSFQQSRQGRILMNALRMDNELGKFQ